MASDSPWRGNGATYLSKSRGVMRAPQAMKAEGADT